MKNAVSTVFFSLDLIVLVGCAVSILHAIPSEIDTKRWKRVLAWSGYILLAVLLPGLFRNDILTTVVMTIYYVGMGRLLYYKNKIGMFYQSIFWMVFLTTQYLAVYTSMALMSILQLENLLYIVLWVILRMTYLMAATFVLYLLIRRRYAGAKRYLKIRGMILIPIFSMALLILYAISSDMFLVRYGYWWMLLFGALLLTINIYCLYFWYDVAKNGELKHRLDMMQQQNALTLQYYQDLEENYSHSRKIIHDIRNHLMVLEQAGRMENSPYITDLHGMLNSLGMRFYTENRMLNIILNDKLKEFPRDQVVCSLGGVNLDFLSDIDTTTIFANLLDNALEAQPDRERRSIRILGEQIHDFTMVKLSNPCEEPLHLREGRSSKAGHEGYGLPNVQAALVKYHGEMQVEQKDGKVSVTLVFQHEKETEKTEGERKG